MPILLSRVCGPAGSSISEPPLTNLVGELFGGLILDEMTGSLGNRTPLSPRHTGMVRSAVLLAALALAFSACSDGSGGVVEGPASEDIAALELPYGPGVEVGQTYDYELYVHCGVRWARLDGVWWETDLLSDGHGNPPDGWGNPFDEGTMAILDERTADYVSGPEKTVRFERTDLVDTPYVCR